MSKSKIKLGQNPIYDIKELSIGKKFLLGLQHTFAMFGATVLVPILTGLDVSTTLLTAGLGTLAFHLITKGQVPIFLGSSFAFLAGYAAVAPNKDPEHLSMALGGVFVAGIVYMIFAALIYVFGVKRIMRFFPPIVTGPIIICIGLTLAPSAINMASSHWGLALLAIAIIIITNIWGRGMMKIVPLLFGIFGSYIVALCFGLVDKSHFHNLTLVAMPLKTEYFATFNLSAIITIVPIVLATTMEHIGDVSAVSATTQRNFIVKPGLHRTLFGDGVATMLGSYLGGPACTTYGENTGVLALTKVYDPRVTRYAAMFAICFAFVPFVSDVINSIPTAIIGGVSLILYGMISAIGIRNVAENQVDLTKSRNLIIGAVILVTGLGFATRPVEFSLFGAHVSLSGIAIAAISGIVLNAILPGNDYRFSVQDPQEYGKALTLSATDSTYEGLHPKEATEDQEDDFGNKKA
ncbi:uracil-xanthine permease family protein [Psittacicella hinzii]|uniref:ABC transporter permease n=1 Tax=Psittacicella hinzii TaxID=2028575 RepID=A0A3A1YQP9_9GAMM|nr:uracil-xanthine permease family protein [Psittacicella hinzii]RIY40613.1 ABC transporter permease [Psittacicella hinzii]